MSKTVSIMVDMTPISGIDQELDHFYVVLDEQDIAKINDLMRMVKENGIFSCEWLGLNGHALKSSFMEEVAFDDDSLTNELVAQYPEHHTRTSSTWLTVYADCVRIGAVPKHCCDDCNHQSSRISAEHLNSVDNIHTATY